MYMYPLLLIFDAADRHLQNAAAANAAGQPMGYFNFMSKATNIINCT